MRSQYPVTIPDQELKHSRGLRSNEIDILIITKEIQLIYKLYISLVPFGLQVTRLGNATCTCIYSSTSSSGIRLEP